MIAIYIILASVCVLLALWLFLIAPGSKRGMEKYRYVKYAHRGLHGTVGADTYAAENSLTAFRRAKEYGFGIELDVRLTKDGEPVVFHDNTLDRVTNGKGEVIEHTLAELRELSLSGTEDTVPTLDEVLELIDGAVPLLVELKENGTDNSVGKKCAERLKTYGGDYIVESFSPMPFGEVRRVLPDVPCGFLADKLTENERFRTLKYKIVESFLLNCVARPAFIAVNHKRPRMFPLPLIRALFSVPTIAWTVRSAEEEKTAYENGFDSVIFEGYMPDGTVAPGGQASDHKEK